MATALFIKRADLVKNTALSGNVDTDKFIQFIKLAQEIHIQNYLGTDLYDKISNHIIAGDLAGHYLSLVNEYIQPMLIHFAMAEYLPFAAYTIANGGVYKHTSEASITAEKSEVDYLQSKARDMAQSYTRRFIDFMCENSGDYPEYTSNTGSDVKPTKKSNFSGWVL